MNRILLVQPHKMLQRAMVVALFPEYRVQVWGKIPEADPVAEADLAIVDAAALHERDSLTASAVRAAQSWRIPIVWIGAAAIGGLAPENLVALTAPIKRDELRAAVAESLRLSAAQQVTEGPTARRPAPPVAAKKTTTAPKSDRLVAHNPKEFIELVDVIEEAPGRDESEAEAGNKV